MEAISDQMEIFQEQDSNSVAEENKDESPSLPSLHCKYMAKVQSLASQLGEMTEDNFYLDEFNYIYQRMTFYIYLIEEINLK